MRGIFTTSCSLFPWLLTSFLKKPSVLAASGKRQAASGKRQAASGKRQAASGKRQAASGKRQAAVLSRTAEPSLFGPILSGMGPFGQHYTAQESKTRAVFRPSAPWFYLDTG
jgi:hypothetical protein